MKKLLMVAAIMASLVGTQMAAEARGGAGGGSGSGGGSGMMTRMGGESMGMRERVRTQTQERVRVRDQSQAIDHVPGEYSGDQLGTRQQLRDPSLHTDVITSEVITAD